MSRGLTGAKGPRKPDFRDARYPQPSAVRFTVSSNLEDTLDAAKESFALEACFRDIPQTAGPANRRHSGMSSDKSFVTIVHYVGVGTDVLRGLDRVPMLRARHDRAMRARTGPLVALSVFPANTASIDARE